MGEIREVRPNAGPQEAFLACRADIAIYGGQAGGGKTYGLVLDPLRWVHESRFGGVIFRRQSVDLIGPGSVWEVASEMYSLFGARLRESPVREFRFPTGALLEMRHLQHEKDKLEHQGKQYAYIGFDELTHFSEGQFWYLVSRLRTTAGMRPYIRATCNPDPDSFVRRLISWWIGEDGFPLPERSGVLRWFVRQDDDLVWFGTREEALEAYPGKDPMSLTFILARLEDNPKGDPTYRQKLDNLPRVERARLLGGNWNIRPSAGEVFRREWFEIIEPEDVVEKDVQAEVRAWDLAASKPTEANPNPDWTAGVRMARMKDGSFLIRDIRRGRFSPGEVEDLVDATAQQDGRRVFVRLAQDPGQAGKDQADRYVRRLASRGHPCRALRVTGSKTDRARGPSAMAERHQIRLVRGAWNEAFLVEAESFYDPALKDDQIDAMADAFAQLSVPVVRFSGSRQPTSLGYET